MMHDLAYLGLYSSITGGLVVWWFGRGLVINRLRVWLPAIRCRVSTWMGVGLWAGKPSRYATSHLDQINLAFHPSRVGKSSTGLSCWG